MVEITFYPAFLKAYKKKIKYNSFLKDKFIERFEIFRNNPFDARLKTHKLTGDLKDLYSFSIDYDNRVIFSFFTDNKVIFEDIGNHDEVY
jgi:mRNA-degrading endonuclease YafQ of YafQ-DinJ toxin-antitoxin module